MSIDAMTLKSWFYDRFVSGYYDRELEETTAPVRARCIERLGIKPGDTVLDLGCGSGLNQPFLAEAVGESGRIIGLDASGGMLAHARSRAEAGGYADRLQLIEGDARQVSRLVNDEVDAVMTTLFFSVVPGWQSVFAASWEKLKPGGRYLVMDTFWPNINFRIRLLLFRYAARAAVPGFEPLKAVSENFAMEDFPPGEEYGFYIATGSRPD